MIFNAYANCVHANFCGNNETLCGDGQYHLQNRDPDWESQEKQIDNRKECSTCKLDEGECPDFACWKEKEKKN